jgi:hypothetical protein
MDMYPLVNCCIIYGKSPFLMGKSTISMVMFNSYVKLPEGNPRTKDTSIGFNRGILMEDMDIETVSEN